MPVVGVPREDTGGVVAAGYIPEEKKESGRAGRGESTGKEE